MVKVIVDLGDVKLVFILVNAMVYNIKDSYYSTLDVSLP